MSMLLAAELSYAHLLCLLFSCRLAGSAYCHHEQVCRSASETEICNAFCAPVSQITEMFMEWVSEGVSCSVTE